MPSLVSSDNQAQAITQVMLNALSQIEQFAAASQIGPDGKPSQTAIYMHMPMGYTVDPKMYANAWTPGGGDSSSSFDNEGTFVTPPPTTTNATASTGAAPTGPAGSVYPPPKVQADQMGEAQQNAFFTASLVDNMLEVTRNGVASQWRDHRVSVEYYQILQGIQPVTDVQPAPDVLAKVAAAQSLMYLKDANGNFIGYTQLYAQYKRNRKAWTDAVAARATAYAQAMVDPVAGQVWPVTAATYDNTITSTLDDFNSMGRAQVEDALNTISTVGVDAVASMKAMGQGMYDAYKVDLGGSVAVGVPWSYISPISWWDHTDESFGVQKIDVNSSSLVGRANNGASSFANDWWHQQSSSFSGNVSLSVGPFAHASGDLNHVDASNAFRNGQGSNQWETHSDKSSSAHITFEYFLATIERPWFLGDMFNMDGWYFAGHKKNSISTGNIDDQVGDKVPQLMPMIPKAFLIIRNVTITADDWGTAGSSFQSAQTNSAGGGESSGTSYGVSVGYLFSSASAKGNSQQAGGAFGTDSTSNAGWSFTANGNGGTLQLLGTQICGWIGEIQPAAPLMDAPDPPATGTAAASGTATTASSTSTTSGSTTTATTTAAH